MLRINMGRNSLDLKSQNGSWNKLEINDNLYQNKGLAKVRCEYFGQDL